MDFLSLSLLYLLSYATVIVIIVFILRIPFLFTRLLSTNDLVVKEYYIKNFKKSIPFDFFLFLVYLLLSYFITNLLKIKSYLKSLLIYALVTCLISGAFGYYFLSQPKTNQIFSRWFHSVGYFAVLYDIILICSTYSLMLFLFTSIKR